MWRERRLAKSTLTEQWGRGMFLVSTLLVAVTGGTALTLLQEHAGSKRALLAAGYGLVVLGVFWVRSLGQRLTDAGWPRWAFWPYFLFVFTGCLAMHFLKIGDARQVLVVFIALQIPAALWRRKSEGTEFAEREIFATQPDSLSGKISRTSEPVDGLEFAVYAVLIAGLWDVLNLLRGDVSGHNSGALRLAIDLGSGFVGVGWVVSVWERMKTLGKSRWTLDFCVVVLAVCSLPFVFKLVTFRQMLIAFLLLEMPLAFARRKAISEETLPDSREF
jgi:hypothetical protein